MNKTVAVIFGGVSSEHEVSLMSVTSVLHNIDRTRYTPLAVGITKAGAWKLFSGDVALIADGSWEQDSKQLADCVLSPDRRHHGLLVAGDNGWQAVPVEIVYPVLHGKNGEDGTVQGLLELSGLPYVGDGVLASACCMDKDFTHRLLTAAGVPNAHWITVRRGSYELKELQQRVGQQLGYPVFVKPANAGSSVGVSKVDAPGALAEALETAFAQDYKVLIEEMLHGAEVECAVLGNDDPVASAVVGEVVPVRGLYDYEGKYKDGSTALYIPARINEGQTAAIRELAVRAYRALECAGLARIDFFALTDGKRVVLNEINTMPGFTNISMYPKLFIASGMSYTDMITRLLELAEADCKQ
ncbi:MAG: D-alanine--D-alanine ligase family protein [Angelakisella sp.]